MVTPTLGKGTRLKRISLWIALLVCVAMFGFVYSVRRIESAITFHPERYNAVNHPVPAKAVDVWFKTDDGVRLHGWKFTSDVSPAKASIIYFHGNSGNITYVGWLGEQLSIQGFDVLLVDYRGYGISEGTIEDESGLYSDGDAAYDYLVSQGRRPDEIVCYGQSLGTAVAVDLAARRGCKALIIESGLSSASEMATQAIPWLPRSLHFLGKNRFDSVGKLPRVHCPVLITHGDPDSVIPTDQSRQLFNAASMPKKLVLFPGADHNVFGSQGKPYLNLIATFLNEDTTPKSVTELR
jgi:fermentation-respiration switch protein FrsA (DUF1100 family)